MNVGFIHGVMNTDNVAISGETIDYGPCAFMEAYDPTRCSAPSTTGDGYAFGNQPTSRTGTWRGWPRRCCPWSPTTPSRPWRWPARSSPPSRGSTAATCCAGSAPSSDCAAAHRRTTAADAALAQDWLALLHAEQVDFTARWRRLADAAVGDEEPLARAVHRRACARRLARALARTLRRRGRQRGN